MAARVVVTGMGIVSSIGHDPESFGNALEAGTCGVTGTQLPGNEQPQESIGAEIRNFSFPEVVRQLGPAAGLSPDLVMQCAGRAPANVQTATVAAMQAWLSSGQHRRACPADRVGLVVGGSNLADRHQHDVAVRFGQALEYVPPSFAFQFMDTNLVGVLSEILGIRGEGFSVGGASASGGVALVKASQMVRHGIADACVVVGAHADLSPITMQALRNIGAMGGAGFEDRPERACRPFDRAHQGFIYGQASGAIVLESLESARRRGARPIAELLGGAIALDGNRLSNPSLDGEAGIMTGVLGQAGLRPEDVQYINTHGTSSPLGDQTEIAAIRRVFSRNVSDVWLNSTKALTGHCLFSAGIVEAIGTVIQMERGFVHPNINLDDPIDPDCRFSGKTVVRTPLQVAMSNSFGFGGFNTSIVMARMDA